MEALGVEVVLFSDVPDETVAHSWAKGAQQRTEYLAHGSVASTFATLPKLPWRKLQKGRGGVEHWRSVTQAAPAARQLAQSCKAQGVTHVHVASCGPMALVAALAHHLYGLSYSLRLDQALSDVGVGQRFKWATAAFGTVASQALHDELSLLLGAGIPEVVAVMPLGVDTDYLRRQWPYSLPEQGKPLRLVASAALAADKGHEALLQAVLQLQTRGISVNLEILGEDAEGGSGFRTELERQVADLGLIGTVFIPGALSEDTLRDRLCSAHVYVMPSPAQVTETAILEAMSCGCPVVAVECPTANQLIVNGRDGILVGAEDTVAFGAALEYLASDPERAAKVGQAGRQRVLDAFDVTQSARFVALQAGLELPSQTEQPAPQDVLDAVLETNPLTHAE
jgi:glycosyltransferase involved in cell wall biosynthesis